MSNETEGLVKRVNELNSRRSGCGLNHDPDDYHRFNVELVREYRKITVELSQRLQAAEDINRIAALDLQAKEQECERLRGEVNNIPEPPSVRFVADETTKETIKELRELAKRG